MAPVRGACFYLTGLSGSGKTTVCKSLAPLLNAQLGAHQNATLVDGDQIRVRLSKHLTLSQEDRSTNVRRIGYFSSLLVKHGGFPLVANIAPYEADRQANREAISLWGPYMEIYVNASYDICKERDPKGLYKQQQNGSMSGSGKGSSGYEVPLKPDWVLDNTNESPEESAMRTLQWANEQALASIQGRTSTDQGSLVIVTGENAARLSEEMSDLLKDVVQARGNDVTNLNDAARRYVAKCSAASKEFPSGQVDSEESASRVGWLGGHIASHGGVAVVPLPDLIRDGGDRDANSVAEKVTETLDMQKAGTEKEAIPVRDFRRVYVNSDAPNITAPDVIREFCLE